MKNYTRDVHGTGCFAPEPHEPVGSKQLEQTISNQVDEQWLSSALSNAEVAQKVSRKILLKFRRCKFIPEPHWKQMVVSKNIHWLFMDAIHTSDSSHCPVQLFPKVFSSPGMMGAEGGKSQGTECLKRCSGLQRLEEPLMETWKQALGLNCCYSPWTHCCCTAGITSAGSMTVAISLKNTIFLRNDINSILM